jgi:hypothetical protein
MRSNDTFVPMIDKNDSSTYSYLAPTIWPSMAEQQDQQPHHRKDAD